MLAKNIGALTTEKWPSEVLAIVTKSDFVLEIIISINLNCFYLINQLFLT